LPITKQRAATKGDYCTRKATISQNVRLLSNPRVQLNRPYSRSSLKGDDFILLLVKGDRKPLYSHCIISISHYYTLQKVHGIYAAGKHSHGGEIEFSEKDMVNVPRRTAVTGPKGNQRYMTRLDTLEKSDFIVIQNRPSKIVDYSISGCFCKGGKMHVAAIDIFNAQKLEELRGGLGYGYRPNRGERRVAVA
jgi:hypothetical protein